MDIDHLIIDNNNTQESGDNDPETIPQSSNGNQENPQSNNDNENNPPSQLPFYEVYSLVNLRGHAIMPSLIEHMRIKLSLDESHKFENVQHLLAQIYYRYVTRFKKPGRTPDRVCSRINLGSYDPIRINNFANSPWGRSYRVATNNAPLDDEILLSLRYPPDIEPYNEVILINKTKCMGRFISIISERMENEKLTRDIYNLHIENFEVIGTITNEYKVKKLGSGEFLSFLFFFYFFSNTFRKS